MLNNLGKGRRHNIMHMDMTQELGDMLQRFRDADNAYDQEYNDPNTNTKRKEAIQRQIVQDKAAIAQEIATMRELAEAQGNQQMVTAIDKLKGPYKVDAFVSMNKYATELQEIGSAAYLAVGGQLGPDQQINPRSLDTLKTDQNLDPTSRQTANLFAHYIPEYNAMGNGQASKMVGGHNGGNARIKKPTQAKDIVEDANGNVLLKPNFSDDPRLISMAVKNMTAFMSGKETGITGRGMIDMMQQEPSELIKNVNDEFTQRARSMDPTRFNNMMRDGVNNLEQDLVHDRAYLTGNAMTSLKQTDKEKYKAKQKEHKATIKTKEGNIKKAKKDYNITM